MKANNKGFTLIEVLVAMGIIMLIAMAFFGINNMSIKVNAKNEKDIQAMNIAQSVMEDVRGYIKEGIKSKYIIKEVYTGDEKIDLNGYAKVFTEETGNEAYTINIKIDRENVESRLYTIIVKVSSKNSNKNTELVTQIFEM